MLFEHDILLIIYYNLIAIGVVAGIGVFLDIFRCFRFGRKKRKKRLDSNDKEGMVIFSSTQTSLKKEFPI